MSQQPNAKPRELFLKDAAMGMMFVMSKDSPQVKDCLHVIEYSAYEELKNQLSEIFKKNPAGIVAQKQFEKAHLIQIIKKLTKMGEFYGDRTKYYSKLEHDIPLIECEKGHQARQTLATVADELKRLGVNNV